jgi:stage III sporulation protein AG
MEVSSERLKRLPGLLKKHKYVLIVLLVGVALLIIPTGEKSDSAGTAVTRESFDFDLDDQEQKLAAALSKIQGAGEVSVTLSLKTGAERIVAQDVSRSESDTETEEEIEIVIVDTDSGEDAVTIKYIYPQYMGALIVSPGAADPDIRLKLTNAAAALTGLGADRITVTN